MERDMVFVEWRDDYNINVATVDQQHRSLVELINKLHESLERGDDREEIGNVFRALVDYTIYHFAEEEKLMANSHMPDLDDHQARHRQFTARLSDLLVQWGMGEEIDTTDLLEYLKSWLVRHILVDDMAIGKHLARATSRSTTTSR
ncbi:bacteriohemerythrin [candidate division GN15 bacterium]|nr:bacteriohemerythrin [candidate division GN15 bacterium]